MGHVSDCCKVCAMTSHWRAETASREVCRKPQVGLKVDQSFFRRLIHVMKARLMGTIWIACNRNHKGRVHRHSVKKEKSSQDHADLYFLPSQSMLPPILMPWSGSWRTWEENVGKSAFRRLSCFVTMWGHIHSFIRHSHEKPNDSLICPDSFNFVLFSKIKN